MKTADLHRLDLGIARAAMLLLSMCAIGCATTQAPAPAATAPVPNLGDPSAPPSLVALPDLAPGASGSTPRTHQGILVARQTLDNVAPVPPSDRSYKSLQRWVDSVVVPWIEQRRAQTDATRDRFLLEANPNPSELAVTHAVVGLINEDTALSLERLPTPSELYNEPEIAAMYRDILRKQSASFASSAVIEFRDCANMAYRGPEDMQSWAHFCHARCDRLREAYAPAPILARKPQ